ncbi:MAG TPA: hypothetical protein VLC46_14475 [Thermoanaerobaculia bacterium]|jgi:hypothetical protein|nr:hypothetical protein [Thermoanaerobaculia bacterium]
MPEPVSLTHAPAVYAASNAAAGDGTALSAEAATIRRSVSAAMESMEQSIALFGPKTEAISEILAVAAEHGETGWNGEGAEPISMLAVDRAVAFIRALPRSVSMPEVAPEPDGSISLDWICSRSRIASISIGVSDRLAFAWLDGTDQGHAVARFDGERIPSLILERIREAMGHAAVRAA